MSVVEKKKKKKKKKKNGKEELTRRFKIGSVGRKWPMSAMINWIAMTH
jgi:hypothetical protein